jgi:hypothetical protein
MVNNSTNINKTTNNLSPKERLNSDGQQFHKNQQTEYIPLTSNLSPLTFHLKWIKTKRPRHILLDKGPRLWKAQILGFEIQPSS